MISFSHCSFVKRTTSRKSIKIPFLSRKGWLLLLPPFFLLLYVADYNWIISFFMLEKSRSPHTIDFTLLSRIIRRFFYASTRMRMKNPFVTAAQRSTYKKWEKSEPVNYSAHSFLFSCIWCVLKLFTEHLNDARHLESMRNFIQEGWFCQNKNLTSNLNDFEYFFPPLRLIPLKRRHRQLESVSRDKISF